MPTANGAAASPQNAKPRRWRDDRGAARRADPAPRDVLDDVLEADERRASEHFVPVTRTALVDRLANPHAWPPGQAKEVRRFFRYLDYWRQQQHTALTMRLLQAYEAFSPDSDLFVTRQYTDLERERLHGEIVAGVEKLLTQANYLRIDPARVEEMILTKDSHYGLDLKVDFGVFDELHVWYRGASVRKELRRKVSWFFRRQEFQVPIFRRVFVLFKIKPEGRHIEEVMRARGLSREDAEKHVRKVRSHLPGEIQDSSIYMKLFKNMPRSDIEMIFPNTQVKFRVMDKAWLGVTGAGAVGAGLYGTLGSAAKLAALSNPVTAAGAFGGLGLVLFRQIMNVMNQKQRYMVTMARNLYFHAMADNRGVMIKLADRAAEEDFKEEILLYSILAKEPVNRRDLEQVDEAIENYLEHTFGLQVDFDVTDALARLLEDGVVKEDAAGNLSALPPAEAAHFIDSKWDTILNEIPDFGDGAGREVERTTNGAGP